MTKEQIKEIAENLDIGFRCFVHKETLEMTFIPDENKHPDIEIKSWKQQLKTIDKTRNKLFEIEGMDSWDSFKIMENFIETVDDKLLKEKLARTIERPRPFRNFKVEIDNSGPYRDKWFVYKQSRLFEWVEQRLLRITM